jgi:hypothetical protein
LSSILYPKPDSSGGSSEEHCIFARIHREFLGKTFICRRLNRPIAAIPWSEQRRRKSFGAPAPARPPDAQPAPQTPSSPKIIVDLI